ncbi:unnamed protein product, partial [marine sediment metagenome]
HYATVFSEAIKDITKDSREAVTIEIRQRPSVQYPIDLWHSVAFTAATLTLDDTYYITGYEHRWNNDTGEDVSTTIWMHKIVTDATSITASEVEHENYVPPQLFHPTPTPWLPVPVPPGIDDGGASIGYVFVSALGGTYDGTDPLIWGGGPFSASWDVQTHSGLCFGGSSNGYGPIIDATQAMGAYVVPEGVYSVLVVPLVQVDDLDSGEIIIYNEVVSACYGGEDRGSDWSGDAWYGTITEDVSGCTEHGALGSLLVTPTPGDSMLLSAFVQD